jgi:hypothetical protein
VYGFSKYNNIDDILKNTVDPFKAYVVISNNEIQSFYYMIDNKMKKLDGVEFELSSWYNFNRKDTVSISKILDEKNVLDIVSSELKVNQIYFISDIPQGYGNILYYVTSEGDYIFMCTGDYLMPAEKFYDLMRAVYAEIMKNPEADGGVDINAVCDLTPFNVNSPSFNVNAELKINQSASNASNAATAQTKATASRVLPFGLIGAGVVLAAGAIVTPVLLVKRRKSK